MELRVQRYSKKRKRANVFLKRPRVHRSQRMRLCRALHTAVSLGYIAADTAQESIFLTAHTDGDRLPPAHRLQFIREYVSRHETDSVLLCRYHSITAATAECIG